MAKDKINKKLETLSRQELIDIAKDLKIKNYSRLSKAELLKMIPQTKVNPEVTVSEPEKKIELNVLQIKAESTETLKKDDNIESLSRQELFKIAKNLNVKNYSKLSKSELLKSINKSSSTDSTPLLGREGLGVSSIEKHIPIEDLSVCNLFINRL